MEKKTLFIVVWDSGKKHKKFFNYTEASMFMVAHINAARESGKQTDFRLSIRWARKSQTAQTF